MNVEPVLIDDDDVVVIVNDDNNISGNKQNATTTEDTIILDDEPMPTPINGATVTDSERESSFARLLKNNTLINKIVHLCLNMENSAGMSRVVSKTLLPLYADADNTFKESEQFTKLLKINLKKLKYDPDHKFLHVKSLCEELKAGKYRRKVPFVTLSRDLKKEKRKRALQLVAEKRKRSMSRKRHDTKEATNICKETDIINLDNSDDEPVITLDVDDDDNSTNNNVDNNAEIMIVYDTVSSDVGSEQFDKENSIEKCDNYNTSVHSSSTCADDTFISTNNYKLASTSVCKEIVPKSRTKMQITSKDQDLRQENSRKLGSTSDLEHSYLTSASEAKISKHLVTKNYNSSNNISHSDLLIPTKAVKPDQHSYDFNRALAIEQQIALYQKNILKLEEEEVTNNCTSSPYVLCDKYKAKIVQLYKKLCKITGNGDGNLLKQRVVRLQVVEGHPPGPVVRLERFLNNSIDETGSVPLPDLHDVVRCVTQSNIADRLGWSKQEIMKEAIALFTQCGHALRKSRQRREYKDLLSLMRDKSLDDYDPANDDQHLFSKLEENKVIAKANEEEILDRFVKMEYMPKTSQTLTPRLGNMSIVKKSGYTDTESDSDLDSTPPKKSKTQLIPDYKKSQETIKSMNSKPAEISYLGDNSKHKNILAKDKTQENGISSIGDVIETRVNALTTITENNATSQTHINTKIITTRDTTNITIQNLGNSTKSNPSNVTTQNAINYTTSNMTSTIRQSVTNTTAQNTNIKNFGSISGPQETTTVNDQVSKSQTSLLWSNTLQKVGNSNRYIVSFESKDTSQQAVSNIKPLEDKHDSDLTKLQVNTQDSENVKVKTEDAIVKQEPIDISDLLDALGDNYISTIFDVEDPFLVVDISSDSSDDD